MPLLGIVFVLIAIAAFILGPVHRFIGFAYQFRYYRFSIGVFGVRKALSIKYRYPLTHRSGSSRMVSGKRGQADTDSGGGPWRRR
jgi:hypothetical protein